MSKDKTSEATQLNYGGQAVIEGVMMRGSKALAVAVRNPVGEIIVHTEPLDARIYGGRLSKMPFLRGLTLLWDALGLGVKSLMFSAEVALEEEDEEDEEGVAEEPNKVFEGPAQWGTVLLSLSLSIGLFFALPAFLAGQLDSWLGVSSPVLSNTFEGLIRLTFLVGYIWIIGFLPDVKRLYGYHGAEHKTINAYEAGAELTPANVATFPLEHPRCGTAFLLTVVLISIILYTFIPVNDVVQWLSSTFPFLERGVSTVTIVVRVVSRILFLPIVAGIAYEFLRFTAANQDKAFIRLITKPNLALQSLTTREPDEGMLEVAITAFERVLNFEYEQVVSAQDEMMDVEPVLP